MEEKSTKDNDSSATNTPQKFLLRVQYIGKLTEDNARALHRSNAPCMTLRKLKTILPSTKPPLEKMIRSGIVYKLKCSRYDRPLMGCAEIQEEYVDISMSTCYAPDGCA